MKIDPVRSAALRLLVELEEKEFPASGRIEQVENSLPRDVDRSLFRSLVTEVLRHRLRLDEILERMLERRSLAELPRHIRAALRMGAAQLLLMPGMAPHAAVDTSVTLARAHGHAGTAALVNAILRRISREGARLWEDGPGTSDNATRDLAIRYSHPEWLVRRFLARWGREEAERILAWDTSIPDYWIRLRTGESPSGARPGWIPGTGRLPAGARPAGLHGFAEGEWTIQDGSGILVGLLPPAVRGRVLDLCAAPGTKTGHLFERAEPGSRLLALDRSIGRVRRMRAGMRRLPRCAGQVGVDFVAADSRRIPVRPQWDGVLLDAPCSNLGVIRRRVDVKWRAREEEIPRLAGIQSELLRSAAAGVVPGGWLVYSVCTLEPEETLARYDEFFASREDWHPLALPDFLPDEARGREGEMILLPGRFETDGTYAFAARRGEGAGGDRAGMEPENMTRGTEP
jgi:16S rRNA (cytosine967-C5)-methyltransferase